MKYQTQKIVKKSQYWHKHGKRNLHEIIMLERRPPVYDRRALQGWCGSVGYLLKQGAQW